MGSSGYLGNTTCRMGDRRRGHDQSGDRFLHDFRLRPLRGWSPRSPGRIGRSRPGRPDGRDRPLKEGRRYDPPENGHQRQRTRPGAVASLFGILHSRRARPFAGNCYITQRIWRAKSRQLDSHMLSRFVKGGRVGVSLSAIISMIVRQSWGFRYWFLGRSRSVVLIW